MLSIVFVQVKLLFSLSFFRWELSCSNDADRHRGVPPVITGPHLHLALVLRKGSWVSPKSLPRQQQELLFFIT